MSGDKTLYLHIGLARTASSSIQGWLHDAASDLASHGLHYALPNRDDDEPRFSGNGADLQRAYRPDIRGPAFDGERFWETFEQRFFADHDRALISREHLASLKPAQIVDFLTRFRGRVHVIAYVRNVYSQLWSSFGNQLKTMRLVMAFREYVQQFHRLPARRQLQHWFDAVGPEHMTVLHFDRQRGNLLGPLLKALGLASDLPDRLGFSLSRTNRGLHPQEVAALMRLRDTGCARLMALAARQLEESHPERSARPPFDPELFAIVERRFRSDLDWINDAFFDSSGGLEMGFPEQAPAALDELALANDLIDHLATRLQKHMSLLNVHQARDAMAEGQQQLAADLLAEVLRWDPANALAVALKSELMGIDAPAGMPAVRG